MPQTGVSRLGLPPLPESSFPGVGYGILPAGPPVGRASPRCYPRVRHRSPGVRRERGRCCPVSRPAVVHCGGGRLCRGRSLWFEFVAGPLHGDVVGKVSLAPQQIRPLANLHLGAALVGRRVAAIAVHAGKNLRRKKPTLPAQHTTFNTLDNWAINPPPNQKGKGPERKGGGGDSSVVRGLNS